MRFALFRRAAPDPAHLDVRHEGDSFRVILRRRATARRMTLRVSSATRDIVLTVPEHTDLAAARRFAEAFWVLDGPRGALLHLPSTARVLT